MKTIKKIGEFVLSKIISYYIELAHKTGRTTITGCYDLAKGVDEEKFILGVWHGESHCCYPLLKNKDIYMVTTTTRRGEYISRIGKHFGFVPLRLPDESKGENHIFKLRSTINGEKKQNLILTLDGPSGPYHEPKKFVLLTALFARRKIILISFNIKGKIQLNKRWDKYVIPLPFYKATVHFHEPMEITKGEIENIGEKITEVLESYSINTANAN